MFLLVTQTSIIMMVRMYKETCEYFLLMVRKFIGMIATRVIFETVYASKINLIKVKIFKLPSIRWWISHWQALACYSSSISLRHYPSMNSTPIEREPDYSSFDFRVPILCLLHYLVACCRRKPVSWLSLTRPIGNFIGCDSLKIETDWGFIQMYRYLIRKMNVLSYSTFVQMMSTGVSWTSQRRKSALSDLKKSNGFR